MGPSLFTKEVVQKMDVLGVDFFRINLSHININEFEETIKKVKDWTEKPVCPDTEGAQLRTGEIDGKNLRLKAGSTVKFGDSSENGEIIFIPLNVQSPEDLLLVGDIL